MNEWGGGDDVDSLRVRVVLLKALFIEETGEVRGCMWCCTLWATEEDGIISICVLDKACLSCALGDYCNVEPVGPFECAAIPASIVCWPFFEGICMG